ncbi:Transcriptional protein SWT1 [Oryzias melastigma]|uniref:Transcriptional protein SWT1 n=1 Tax=Oryzias melastigma TaxID=30732 RepID=A0A834KWV7_ORYME|nr:Transcriptional protein SWT1 [Oryzias melastigma]
MNSNSKKRRRRRVSSSSSEEGKRGSRKKEDTKSTKRHKDYKGHESSTKEQKKSVKEDSQTSRHVKKPVYKHSKTHGEEEHKAVKKDKQHTITKNAAVPLPGEVYSTKEKANSSGKHNAHKTEVSKPKDEDKHGTSEKTAKVLADKCSSLRSPSTVKKRRMSPSVDLTEQGNQTQHVEKKKAQVVEPSRTEADSIKTKDQDPSSTYCENSADPKMKLPENTINLTTSENNSEVLSSLPGPPVSDAPVSPPKPQLSSVEKLKLSQKFVPFKFKIPKKVRPNLQRSKDDGRNAVFGEETEESKSKASHSKIKLAKIKPVEILQEHSYLDDPPNSQLEEEKKTSSPPDKLPPENEEDNTKHLYDQMQVVEELHLARSEKRLEVNVIESYGELTSMDIDVPEEASSNILRQEPHRQVFILVLDTNILLSHLDYVIRITSHGLGALGFPVVLIPWVVLQELDSLKRGRGLSGSVAHLAIPAISYIYNTLKKRHPRLWGQSMQQAAQSCNGLNAENNDDRVLQCCLQYQNLYPECALILCTNDKNLSSKALLSGIRALSKKDLEAEVEKSKHPVMPHNRERAPSPMSHTCSTPAPPKHQQQTVLSQGFLEEDETQKESDTGGEDEEEKQRLSECLSDLEKCLRDVLSAVVEKEMKVAFDDIWHEVVCIKPPWTLNGVLQCLKKHWIAVFGLIVPRNLSHTVTDLINFFNSGKTPDCHKTSAALQQAKEFVEAFSKRSHHVSQAISEMERISNKLQPQPLCVVDDSLSGDVVMNEDEVEDKQPTSVQVSHQEVWGIFENIWSHIYQTSLEVFKALRFDPHTMQIVPLEGGLTFPQDALACLHRLASVVLQLLQAFSSILSSAPGLEEVQTLLSVIYSNQIIHEDSRLTATALVGCFSQPDYREKLRVGGGQLMELKKALDCCVQASDQHIAFTTQPK